jgi:hypothetical protein
VGGDSGVCVLGGGIRVPHDASDHRRRRRGKAEDPPAPTSRPCQPRVHRRLDLSQAVRVARRKHGIERPGHAEPEPLVVEGADEVEEAKDEVVASSTVDDAAESEALQRTVSGLI